MRQDLKDVDDSPRKKAATKEGKKEKIIGRAQ